MTQKTKTRRPTPKKTTKPTKAEPAHDAEPRVTLAQRLQADKVQLTFPLQLDPTIGKHAARDVPEIAAYDHLLGEMDGYIKGFREKGHVVNAIAWERTRSVAANARGQMLQKYLRAEGLS